MGDRISIQFKNGEELSPYLFSHWRGEDFLKEVESYLENLEKWINKQSPNVGNPLNRLDPGVVMVDFIREVTKNKQRITGDIYLTREENEGDNSDNGHHIINLE